MILHTSRKLRKKRREEKVSCVVGGQALVMLSEFLGSAL